ncbi:MAG TPA: hypothetical protein VNO22_03685 [Planctomycetota bacterium]|jgi:hypothetical protein|nr:hypothetical protein [Planctomycetota bacterium]
MAHEPLPSPSSAVPALEEQRQVLANAAALAEQVARIVKENGLSMKFGNNPREYVRVEGWLTISRVQNEQPHAKVEEVVRDPESGHETIHARAWLTNSQDQVVSLADGYCSTEEPGWRDKPFYARASMAQTRAIAKAMRLRHAWVMVLAGYAPTPAEEMSEELLAAEPPGAPGPLRRTERPAPGGGPRPAEAGTRGVAQVTVKAVSERPGEKRDGTPYVRYGIRGSDGVWYNTFNPRLGELAKQARESGARVTISYSVTEYGHDVEDLQVAEEGAEPPEMKRLGA